MFRARWPSGLEGRDGRGVCIDPICPHTIEGYYISLSGHRPTITIDYRSMCQNRDI